MNLIAELEERGFIYQCTDLEALKELVEQEKIKFYVGFDCTATSLHVGNLTMLMLIRTFQKYGHTPMILIGNATTEVGDPTGKDQMRKILTPSQIDDNIEGIKHSIEKIVNTDHLHVVRNKDWLKEINYLEFLTSWGRIISVNKMMSLEIVKNRLDNQLPLSYLELNYMILQGYDFCYLNQHHNCVLQCGGSDQWGNITFGVEMNRKFFNRSIFGLTTPLLTTKDGKKMGKTEKGAVWLNEDMLSAYDYFQYWRNMHDEDILRFGKMFGELSEKDMLDIEDINERKAFVAYKITEICHGTTTAQRVLENSKKIFAGDSNSFPLEELSKDFLDQPVLELIGSLLGSRKEARRYLEAGAVKLNNEKFFDLERLTKEMLDADGRIHLTLGKKKHYLLTFV